MLSLLARMALSFTITSLARAPVTSDIHACSLSTLTLTGIVLTNDGHAILREIDVTHPAAKVSRGRRCCHSVCVSREGAINQGACLLTSAQHMRGESARCMRWLILHVVQRVQVTCSHDALVCAYSPQSMIQLSRTQDEEVGDGTTSVIILGERRCLLVCLSVLLFPFSESMQLKTLSDSCLPVLHSNAT